MNAPSGARRRKGLLSRLVLPAIAAVAAAAALGRGDVKAGFQILRREATTRLDGLRRIAASLVPERTTDSGGIPPIAVPGPRSAPSPGRQSWMASDNWTRAKADEDIDSLTPDDVAAIESWDSDKRRAQELYDRIRATVSSVTSVPAYSCNARRLEELRKALDDLGECIERDDPLRLAYDVNGRLGAAANAWTASVQWRAGVPHPTAPHVHSGGSRNSWEPDDGYVFADNAAESLSVVYKGHPFRCNACDGRGYVRQTAICPGCQGRGRVPNPIAQTANTAITVLNLANALSKHPRPMPSQMHDPGITCSQCGGSRKIAQTVDCARCDGGTIWR